MDVEQLRSFKFKKLNLNGKKLTGKKLKEPKLAKSLPKNKGITRVFNIAKNKSDMPGMKNARRMMSLKPAQEFGMNRIKQQRGLNPWGDYDGDGVINMLDCNPRNKYKQGPENDIEDEMNPSDELRRNYNEDNLPIQSVNWTYGKRPENNGIDPDSVGAVEAEYTTEPVYQKKGFKDSARQKLDQFSSFLESQKSIKQEQKTEQDLRRDVLLAKAKEKAQKDYEKQFVKDQAKVIASRRVPPKTAGQKISMGFSRAGAQTLGGLGTIPGAARGVQGFGISQSNIRSATQGMSNAQKLLTLLGKNPQAQPIQSSSQAYSRPMPAQTASVSQPAQAEQDEVVYSPYSKRKVTYIRGQYRKREV